MEALFQLLKRLVAPLTAAITAWLGYRKGKADAESDQRSKDIEAAKLRNRVESELARTGDDDISELRKRWSKR